MAVAAQCAAAAASAAAAAKTLPSSSLQQQSVHNLPIPDVTGHDALSRFLSVSCSIMSVLQSGDDTAEATQKT
jgi:hypothetical protein